MTLLQKIRDWRINHQIIKAIADGAALYSAGNITASAIDALIQPQNPIITEAKADFYDGCPGPNQLQLDQRLSFSGGTPNYTLLPKAFIDENKDGQGLFLVTPFNYTPNNKPAVGVGVGSFFNLGKKINLLGVMPMVYSFESKALNFNPAVYATFQTGKLLVDSRLSYLASFSGDSIKHNLTFGTTLGLKLDNIIVGIDGEISFDPKIQTNYQGVLRIDLDSQHKNWLQAYLSKDAVGIGFRANFDLK